MRRLLGAAAVAAIVLGACGTDPVATDTTTTTEVEDTTTTTTTSTEEATTTTEASEAERTEPGTLTVGVDFDTIQDAVDAAIPGDLILIEPGEYHEAVDVTTDDLVIRGLDREGVVLDGRFELENGVRVLGADGVAVENLTVRNYTRNGLFWTTEVEGYRASYVTAVRNGDYGVYTFGARDGIIEHAYASGSPDAGFYIGQCYPCNAVIRDVISEYNGLGYSGTNSGGELYIINSTFRFNRAGIVPNSGSYEGCAPERESTLVGNLVHSNNNGDTAAISAAILGQGNGILVAGGIDNLVERNRVWDHDIGGIAIVPFPEDDPIAPIPDEPDTDCLANAVPASDDVIATLDSPLLWPATGNLVRGNHVTDSREADLILVGQAVDQNRFCDNEAATSLPVQLQERAPCVGELDELGPDATVRFLEILTEDRPPSADYREVVLPDPGPQPQMPDAATAPAQPARNLDLSVDIDAIALPDAPAGS